MMHLKNYIVILFVTIFALLVVINPSFAKQENQVHNKNVSSKHVSKSSKHKNTSKTKAHKAPQKKNHKTEKTSTHKSAQVKKAAPIVASPTTIKKITISSSILPVYSLVAMATEGLSNFENNLIIQPNQDEHSAELKLNQISTLTNSDVVFIATRELEKNILSDASKHQYLPKIVALGDLGNATRYALQASFIEKTENQENYNHYVDTTNAQLYVDPHLWLSITNAKIMLSNIVDSLIILSPKDADKLVANKIKYIQKLTNLHNEIYASLSNINKNIISYHNAWQYFMKDYNINYLGSITTEDEEHEINSGLSPKKLGILLTDIKTQNVQCIFNEEQFNDPVIGKITQQSDIKILTLNPMGVLDPKIPASQIYFNMIRHTANQIKIC